MSPIPPFDTSGTIPRMFIERARLSGERPALFTREGDRWAPTTYGELEGAVRRAAAGLISLGVKPGDRVAIMSYNRPEWAVADLAILAAGAVTIPIYHTSTQAQSDYILQKSGARIAFVSRSEKAEMLLTCDASIETMIALDAVGTGGAGPCALDYHSLLLRGTGELDGEGGRELERRIADRRADDIATIVFTSGTTGEPKGVMLSHGNLLVNAADGYASQPLGEEDTFLSFLPLSHLFERSIGHFMMIMAGIPVAYARSIRTVAADARLFRPTVMLAVPRFLEKFHEKVIDGLTGAPLWRRSLFFSSLSVGKALRARTARGKEPGPVLRLLYDAAERLVFSRLREGLGGRIRFIVCGGAPLAPEIVEFFTAAGIEVLEGYGLTEASPVISVNRHGRVRPGTVGVPFDHVETRIASDGEILVRGPSVMLGYFEDKEATDEVIRGGWLHTGDIGTLDGGSLRITGRKKDIIVTAGGKNVSPQKIEGLLEGDEVIGQVVVHGDRRKFLTALVVPEFRRLREILGEADLQQLDDVTLAERREVYDLLMERISARSTDLASYERIRKIVVLGESLTQEKGEVTPTMKVRRDAVAGKFRERLDALYGE
ncbi:AMP-dependent synthetase/ligase [Candidatus Moduliflexota bacterium]